MSTTHYCTQTCGCGLTVLGNTWITTTDWSFHNGYMPKPYIDQQRYQQVQADMMKQLAPAVEKKIVEEKPVYGLFEVFIVDPFGFTTADGVLKVPAGDLAYECKTVAASGDSAKIKAYLAFQTADDLSHYRGRDLENFDIIVRRIGDVRSKS